MYIRDLQKTCTSHAKKKKNQKPHKNCVQKNNYKKPYDPSILSLKRYIEITSIVFITPLLVQVIVGQPTRVLYL